MAAIHSSFSGNSFVGLFAKATDKFIAIPASSHEKFEAAAKRLSQNVVRASISSSPYLGIYMAANSKGVVLAPFCSKRELEAFERGGIEVEVINDTKFSALGNNIACNDHAAIVNEDMPRADIKKIEGALCVEAVPMPICGHKTVGMMLVATNKGFLAHNRISEDELKRLEKILKVGGLNSTVNSGTPIVGLGVVANSSAAIVGEDTTGFELGRLEQALELTD
ncbi:MAG: translation initiation factor IF-6 [Candidatus Micrarchaeota archaeon]